MNAPNIQITPTLSFNLIMNETALSALQRALSWTVEHSAYPPEDPIHHICEEFTKLLQEVADNQSLLGGMGVKISCPEVTPRLVAEPEDEEKEGE